MNRPFDFDSRLSSWLDEQAVPGAPDGLLGQVVERAAHTRRRPAWATLERWVSMETRARIGAVPRTAIILLILGVLLAVLSAIALGQQPSPKLPPTLGPARNGLIAFDDGGDIYVVNPDGTGRKALTSGPAVDTAPEWSDDGTRIAYFSQQEADGPAAIKVMDAEGTDGRTLVEGVTLPPVSWHVSWSADGRSLAYADRTTRGALAVDRIMVIPSAGGEPAELVSPGQAPTWSPDGRLIAYQSGGMGADGKTVPQGLSVVGVDGTDQRVIDGGYTDNPWAYAYPQWSSDGEQLAYHGGASTNAQIRIAAVNGSDVTSLGHGAISGVWPVWSPDDSRLALSASSTDGRYQIYLVNPDGSGFEAVVHPSLGCNCAFRWSPDGTKVIAWQDGDTLMVADVAASVPVEIIGRAAGSDMSWQRLAP